jgi:TBC1 domain family member 16
MSDLLAPLLSTLQDEPLAYWCFCELMKQTLFCQSGERRSVMEIQLDYLRQLLGLFAPEVIFFCPQVIHIQFSIVNQFHAHLHQLGGDAPNLMFVHRWILLFFKREFPPREALHIWEVTAKPLKFIQILLRGQACWTRYRSAHFHLFVACAIVTVFGPDVVAQKLPHDEVLLYFSSLAMHMDAGLILRKVGPPIV